MRGHWRRPTRPKHRAIRCYWLGYIIVHNQFAYFLTLQYSLVCMQLAKAYKVDTSCNQLLLIPCYVCVLFKVNLPYSWRTSSSGRILQSYAMMLNACAWNTSWNIGINIGILVDHCRCVSNSSVQFSVITCSCWQWVGFVVSTELLIVLCSLMTASHSWSTSIGQGQAQFSGLDTEEVSIIVLWNYVKQTRNGGHLWDVLCLTAGHKSHLVINSSR